MGPLDAERVEYSDGVGGQVRKCVGHRRALACADCREHAGHVGRDVGELGRQADVTVVEADHEEAFGDELLAPLDAVVDALRAEPVHEQQGRLAGFAEGLVVQLDVAVAGVGHQGPPQLGGPIMPAAAGFSSRSRPAPGRCCW